MCHAGVPGNSVLIPTRKVVVVTVKFKVQGLTNQVYGHAENRKKGLGNQIRTWFPGRQPRIERGFPIYFLTNFHSSDLYTYTVE